MAKGKVIQREEVNAAFVRLTEGLTFTTMLSGVHKVDAATVARSGTISVRTYCLLRNGWIAIVPQIKRVVGLGPFCPYYLDDLKEIAFALERLNVRPAHKVKAFIDLAHAYEDAYEARSFGKDLSRASLLHDFKITAEQRRKLGIA